MNSPLKSNWSPEGCLSLISKYLWNLQVAPEEKKIEGVSEPLFFAFKSRFGSSAHSTTFNSEGGQGSYEGQITRSHKIVRIQGLLKLRGQFLSTPGFT